MAEETPDAESMPQLDGVVVGHDGSREAATALLWAADEAALRRRPLRVVRAWTTTTAPRPADSEPGYVPSTAEFAAACEQELEAAVRPVRESHPDLTITVHAVHGSASSVLVGVSEEADLLVVGHRGRAGLRARMLGSTSSGVVERAGCSVLVVRPYRT